MSQTNPDYASVAADLVKTMIANGTVKDPSVLPQLLEQIGDSLKKVQETASGSSGSEAASASAGEAEAPQAAAQVSKFRPVSETGQEPAVPLRQSVQPDYIICLEDGRKMKMLRRHLRTAYGMTPEEYRAKWGLPPNYPMVAPNYAKQKSKYARHVGLGTHRMREEAAKKRMADAD